MKNSLNRISNRQYLLDITLFQFSTNYSKELAKIFCELHYDENYVKFKKQPCIKNTTADFQQEKMTIPFSIDVALVFKEIKSNKRQQFLGHYSLQIQQYLKQGRWTINALQRLEETQSWIRFQCKIIDKTTLEESSLDEISQDDNLRKSQFSVIFQDQPQKPFYKRPATHRANSQLFCKNYLVSQLNLIKSFKSILLPQQFQQKLHEAQEIIYKKNLERDIQQKIQKFKRDGKGLLKTQKIITAQEQLSQAKKQVKKQKILIYLFVIISSFFLGMIIS